MQQEGVAAVLLPRPASLSAFCAFPGGGPLGDSTVLLADVSTCMCVCLRVLHSDCFGLLYVQFCDVLVSCTVPPPQKKMI